MSRYQPMEPMLVLRPCAGVLCPQAECCARYQIVDGTSLSSEHWLDSCWGIGAAPSAIEFPAFISTDFIGPPEPRHYRLTRADIRRWHMKPPGSPPSLERTESLRVKDNQHPFVPSTIEVFPVTRRRSWPERVVIALLAAIVAVLSFAVGFALPNFVPGFFQ
jgi:hypothetical protein